MIVVIGMSVLCVTGCRSSRSLMSTERVRASVGLTHLATERDSMVMHDSVVEVTTITIRENERGDTIRVSTVTDRERIRNRAVLRDSQVRIKVDTVYIESRDSVLTKSEERKVNSGRVSSWVLTLKWVFWIIIAFIALIIVVRIILLSINKLN